MFAAIDCNLMEMKQSMDSIGSINFLLEMVYMESICLVVTGISSKQHGSMFIIDQKCSIKDGTIMLLRFYCFVMVFSIVFEYTAFAFVKCLLLLLL